MNKSENEIRPLIIIMGPTASGKTALSLEVANLVNGEIINADSMQIYKNLNIGTAKATSEEQLKIRHHLLDVVDIHHSFDVYQYIELATAAIKQISAQGKTPIICGGTGYYIKSLLYGLDLLPGDRELRKELDQRFNCDLGEQELKMILSEKDPEDYQVYQLNRRKLIRAYEVFLLTGKSLVSLQSADLQNQLKFPLRSVIRLQWPREVLKERIRQRVEQMIERGWIQETEQAMNDGFLNSPTAKQAIGYTILAQYLQNQISLQEACTQITIKSCQYARRQNIWFNHQPPSPSLVLSMPMNKDLEIKQLFQLG